MKIVDTIGYFGPHINFIITIILLWKQNKYLYGYLIFYIISVFINILLKSLIREPRPTDGKNIMDFEKNAYEGIQEFGMPSGHAQSVLYSTIFIYYVLRDVKITAFYVILSLFTIFQRVQILQICQISQSLQILHILQMI
jgi:membrane-associated phospholipid phosphatase